MTTKEKLLALDLGCGDRRATIDGYSVIGVDIRGEVKPDIVASFEKLPIPDSSYDLVFASHVLEHVKRADVPATLKEWRRVLKVGGKLKIIVPDLEMAAIEVLSCMTSPATFDTLWGPQSNIYDIHYSGYSNMILEAMIVKYGFEVNHLKCVKDLREIHLTATKLDIDFKH